MKLSVIIPFYKNYHDLSRCLASLAKQSIFNLFGGEVEVIVVDDGSESRNYAEQYAELRGKMNIIFFKIEHSGAAAARNFGFQKSTGEYIFFCDSDVVFLKNDALEKMIKKLDESPAAAFVYSSFKFGWKKFPGREFDAEELKKNNYISTMSLVRREWLNKISPTTPWNENLKRFQDWDLWLSIVENGGEGIFISEFLWQAKSGGTISYWLPSLFYKLFPWHPLVKNYRKNRKIVLQKHNLA